MKLSAPAGLYELRHRIVSVGLPALVSRGSMVAWGILTILIIRKLPEEAYAVYAVARSLEMFGVLLGGGFVHQAVMKLVAEGDTERERRLANAGVLVALAFAAISAFALIAGEDLLRSFYGALDLGGIPALLAGVVVTGTLSGLPRSLLLAKHRTKHVMLSDLLQFAVKGGVVGILLFSGALNSAHQIFIATIAANLAACIVSLWLARDLFSPRVGTGTGEIGTVMGFAVVTLGTSLANFVYSRTDILMLGKLKPDDVAAYGASRTLAGMVLPVVAAANMVLLPLVSRMWKQGRRREVLSRIWGSVFLAEVLMAPVVFAYVVFPGRIMNLVYGGKYTEAWPVMMVLGGLSVVRPLGSFFSTASAAVGKPQYSLYSVLISSIFNVALNIVLIPALGGLGAALATAAAVVTGTVWVVWASIRYMSSEAEG